MLYRHSLQNYQSLQFATYNFQSWYWSFNLATAINTSTNKTESGTGQALHGPDLTVAIKWAHLNKRGVINEATKLPAYHTLLYRKASDVVFAETTDHTHIYDDLNEPIISAYHEFEKNILNIIVRKKKYSFCFNLHVHLKKKNMFQITCPL